MKPALEVVQIPVLQDNYIYLVRQGDDVAVVDPAVGEPVLEEAKQRGWAITQILNTHWHPDHVGANLMIKAATNCKITGPAVEAQKIPGIDRAVQEGDIVSVGGCNATVIDVPGHTLGHNAYYFATDHRLFCGDTLFALGCGRLFEGTADQMWESLGKLATLPPETEVYCAHEYTLANGQFALHVDADNAELVDRMKKIREARAENRPTVPSTIALERATNPFLRAGTVAEFARRRAAKDVFRG
jgi:hydroxyacylglutathione hydrolase